MCWVLSAGICSSSTPIIQSPVGSCLSVITLSHISSITNYQFFIFKVYRFNRIILISIPINHMEINIHSIHHFFIYFHLCFKFFCSTSSFRFYIIYFFPSVVIFIILTICITISPYDFNHVIRTECIINFFTGFNIFIRVKENDCSIFSCYNR